jgi:hypothetical protein
MKRVKSDLKILRELFVNCCEYFRGVKNMKICSQVRCLFFSRSSSKARGHICISRKGNQICIRCGSAFPLVNVFVNKRQRTTLPGNCTESDLCIRALQRSK